MVEYDKPGVGYEKLKRREERSIREEIKAIDKSIAEARKHIEYKDRNVSELKKGTQNDEKILKIPTREVHCDGCGGKHTIPDIPGDYDLCVASKHFWKTLQYFARLNENGEVSYFSIANY